MQDCRTYVAHADDPERLPCQLGAQRKADSRRQKVCCCSATFAQQRKGGVRRALTNSTEKAHDASACTSKIQMIGPNALIGCTGRLHTRRAIISMAMRAPSAALAEFTPGAVVTGMPHAAAASISMLLYPGTWTEAWLRKGFAHISRLHMADKVIQDVKLQNPCLTCRRLRYQVAPLRSTDNGSVDNGGSRDEHGSIANLPQIRSI